ncbi:MAG: metallophosphoesterase family protein [Anaerolineae bacterium]
MHGSPRSHWESIFASTPDEEVLPMLQAVEEDLVITGHTHLQMDRQVGRWRVLNPGPVGMPLDGYYEANYMLLESCADGWTPTFRRVAYDITPLLREFERIGFVEACGATGKMIVEEFASARPRIDPFNRWRRQVYPGQPATMAMADEFMTLDDKWQYMLPPFRINMEI